MTVPSHPHQPLRGHRQGGRFKANPQVVFLTERHPDSVDALLSRPVPEENKVQFVQLLGWTLAQVQARGWLVGDLAPSPLPKGTRGCHPIQPLQLDDQGVVRFKANALVSYMLDTGPCDMNTLAMQDHPPSERRQLAQLIGYSYDGGLDLSYMPERLFMATWNEWVTREQRLAEQTAQALDAELPHARNDTTPRTRL